MNRFFTICMFSILAAGTPAAFGQALQAPAAPPDLSQFAHGQPQQGSTTGTLMQPKRTTTPTTPPDAVTPYNEGAALLKAKNYAAAAHKFEASIKANQ